MPPAVPDRNLLYAVLARRLGLIADPALLDAQDAWSRDPRRSLALVLLERHALAPEDHARIEAELHRIEAARPRAGPDPEARHLITKDISHPDAHSPTQPPPAGEGGTTLADSPALDPNRPPSLPSTLADPDLNGETAPPPRPPAAEPGRFRVVRFHARGGLGQVSRAWDGQLGRQVALKELLPGQAESDELRARFILEAEINGNLEHPGIVPVYALGSFPDGRPYYAMRFVEGQTLQQALDAFHERAATLSRPDWTLGLRGLLGHFLDVCDAIAYAHSRGVLHRDIKPSNILIGRFGETLIIDWGLAKATGRPEPGREDDPAALRTSLGGAAPTRAGIIFGSPPYMSPEQAAGRIDDLTRASDIYSLGATLYALLTGRPPVLEKHTRAALERVLRGDIDPPRAGNRRVPPPLEAVCRKAMSLDPADRYPSAHALADDLRRWMADEPVAVHAESPATRALRWARHHRPLVVGAAALTATALVALAISAAVVRVQRDEAREARRLAEYHALNGVRLINELVTLGDRQIVGANVPADRRRQLLQGALHFIGATRDGRPHDPKLRVEAALIARRLAHLYGIVGDYERADPLFDESIASFRQIAGADPGSDEYRNLLAEALIDRAELHRNRGDARGADDLLRQAVQIARPNPAEQPADPNSRRTLARALSHSSEVLRKLGQAPSPDPAEEAAALLEPLADAGLPTVAQAVRRGSIPALLDQLEYVTALVFLAEARASRGDSADAAAPIRRALDRMDDLDRRFRDSSAPDVPYFRAWSAVRFAALSGDDPAARDEALRRLDGAIERLTGLVRENRDYVHFRATLAEARAIRAHLLAEAHRPGDAAADADAARRLLDDLIEAHPQVPDFPSLLATVEQTTATLADRPDDARRLLREALRLQDEALRRNPQDPAYTRRRAAHREALEALGPPGESPE